MVIITKNTLSEFARLHPNAVEPLNHWYSITHKCDWGSFADVRKTFNSVDAVGMTGLSSTSKATTIGW
jgi:mRNA interferase HigB